MEQQLNIKCVNTTTDSDGAIYGKFVVEPLGKGFGTTLGNALRRVLLSGLEGAAVTSARIEGVSHEFTTIANIKEDVMDILLNLKGIVFKTTTDEPQQLRLDMDKPGAVYAGDIQLPSDVKVINPDRLICTLSEGGSIHADLTIEMGKGYVPAVSTVGTSVDVMPIDAVYMPVRRVAYTVEDTRVGQRTDYDKLTLEVWTNGSIDVSEALSRSANQLIEHFLPIASLSGTPKLVLPNVSDEPKIEAETTTITIEDLELSVRAFNCLKRANINSMGELMQKSEHDLLNIKNFGKKSADEVIERLHAFNLDLKPNPEGVELIYE
jgi:DNA-directed RNA polymerase subunit alpha